jgi:hypothetical protein
MNSIMKFVAVSYKIFVLFIQSNYYISFMTFFYLDAYYSWLDKLYSATTSSIVNYDLSYYIWPLFLNVKNPD